MIYELAKPEDIQAVYNVVQHTIKTIYPKYYPMEVVDFFCGHHSEDALEKDIKNGYVSVLKIDGTIVATGCFVDNHITRVYVLPEHQKKGYGTFIMKNIEEQIGEKFDKAYLDASLPAAALYEKLGFDVVPNSIEPRQDIIQAVTLKSPERLIAFCKGIQAAAPVDSYVDPEPWDMPGYDSQVIMAAGAFVQGSSIELSADGPVKEPYAVYFQGGLTWEHAKLGVMMSLQKLVEQDLVKLQ